MNNSVSWPLLGCDSTTNYISSYVAPLVSPSEAAFYENAYDTYSQQGLPPGPISNPGMFSLKAALDPLDTGYYFYALDPSIHEHKFFKTYDEHKDFLASLGY